jgi:hypothetical protein
VGEEEQRRLACVPNLNKTKGTHPIGIPIPIIILLWLFGVLS